MKNIPLYDPQIIKFFISKDASKVSKLWDAKIENIVQVDSVEKLFQEPPQTTRLRIGTINSRNVAIGDNLSLAEVASITQKGIAYFDYTEDEDGSLNLKQFTVNTHDCIDSSIDVMYYGDTEDGEIKHAEGKIKVEANVQGLELVLTDAFGDESIVDVYLENGSDWHLDVFAGHSDRGVKTIVKGRKQKILTEDCHRQ